MLPNTNKVHKYLSLEKINVSVPLRVLIVFVKIHTPITGQHLFLPESKPLKEMLLLKTHPIKKPIGIGRSSKAAGPQLLTASHSRNTMLLFSADWAKTKQYLKQGCEEYLPVILCWSYRADWWINTARWISKTSCMLVYQILMEGKIKIYLCYK